MTGSRPPTTANPPTAARRPTVVHAFTAVVAARPEFPLMTFYDDSTGERTELSGATLANWVAKTANLLVDGLGLAPGDIASVRLPPHWQTAAVLLGSWAAGLTVDLSGGPGAVGFVAEQGKNRQERSAAEEVYALALHPFGTPFPGGPPAGTADFVLEMRPYGDHLPPLRTGAGQPAFADGTTHAQLVASAPRLPGRVLVDAETYPDPREWLVGPLLAGASIVLCRHLATDRLDARLATERAQRYEPTTG